MKHIFSLLFCVSIITNLLAQDEKIEWGKVPNSDLEMTTYPLDEEANAVILSHVTTVHFQIRPGKEIMQYEHHIRIKILNKAGLDYANIELPYYSKKKRESISGIKAHTFTLKNGKPVKVKLKNKQIFSDKKNEYWTIKKFTFPAVEVGSVIEYKYKHISTSSFSIEDFYFQNEIPTRWSKYIVEVPEFFHYVATKQTDIPFTIEDSKEMNYNLGAEYKLVKGMQHTWAMKNVAALKEESFITTMNDYRQRIRMQLQAVVIPGQNVKTYFSDWKSTLKELMEDEDFGQRFTKKKNIDKVKKQCPVFDKKGLSKKEKMEGIYAFVQKNMKWNNNKSIYSMKSPNDRFSKGEGSNGDINLMLLALLNQTDILAFPVLLSTRSNGRANPFYPILKQFDYVIVQAMIDGKPIYLDAVDPLLPPGMLRRECLNEIGWLMSGKEGKWQEIKPQKATEAIRIEMSIDEKGNAKGFIEGNYGSYAGLRKRQSINQTGGRKDKYLEKRIKEDIPNIKIDSLVFKNKENLKEQIKETIYFTIPNFAEVGGDLIYVNPILKEGWNENPFQLKERTYPVDFAYPITEQIIIKITPPKGYEIEELPKNARVNLLDGGGNFMYMAGKMKSGDIQIISKVKFKRPRYLPKEYPFLKQFCDLIVESHLNQIVLKKIKP